MKKFSEIQEIINTDYTYEPNGFTIGNIYNDSNNNQWSGKIASYAVINNLTNQETLELFGEHYQSVLDDPNGTGHANVRALIKYGLTGVKFDNNKLLISKK